MRNTYSTAARVTAGGELKLPSLCWPVPVKSTTALRLARSTLTATRSGRPLSMVYSNEPLPMRSITRRTDSSALSITWRM